MSRRLTDEEEKVLERMQAIEKELREIKDEKYLLNREHDNIGDTKNWDKSAPIFWGILTLIWVILLAGDLVVGFGTIGMTLAIMLASATPALAIFCFIMFAITLRRYRLMNSANPKIMEKAARLGFKNRVALQLRAEDKRRELELREIDLKSEKDSIQKAYDEASRVEWY